MQTFIKILIVNVLMPLLLKGIDLLVKLIVWWFKENPEATKTIKDLISKSVTPKIFEKLLKSYADFKKSSADKPAEEQKEDSKKTAPPNEKKSTKEESANSQKEKIDRVKRASHSTVKGVTKTVSKAKRWLIDLEKETRPNQTEETHDELQDLKDRLAEQEKNETDNQPVKPPAEPVTVVDNPNNDSPPDENNTNAPEPPASEPKDSISEPEELKPARGTTEELEKLLERIRAERDKKEDSSKEETE